MGSVSHVIKIQDILRSVDDMYSYGFPEWLVELCENHKSSWIPNSKGGEPFLEGVYVQKSDKPEFREAYTMLLEERNKILSEREWIIEKAERKAFQKGLALGSASMWIAYIIVHLIGGVL